MYTVLIVGANFVNKGAQSMLFITMDELRKRIPNVKIYFATFEENIDENQYKFDIVFYNPQSVQIALHPELKKKIVFRTRIKNFIIQVKNAVKRILRKEYTLYIPIGKLTELSKVIKDVNLIIDISGFGLGEKWGIGGSKQYLNNIKLARKFSIPMALMPQSFGPFNYEGDCGRQLISEIKNVLSYPYKIFAREKQGYDILKNEFHLHNVEQSFDLVLQNKGVDYKNIFCENYSPKEYVVSTKRNVAIIPNAQCFRHGNKELNFHLYREIIDELIKKDRNVYVIGHASEDHELCVQIVNLFAKEEKVHLFEHDLSCLEYDLFIKQFDYIVCSRFHGIVHAYRNSIPCIVLGWAIKYQALTKSVKQEKYAFDITDGLCAERDILDVIKDMNENYGVNSKIIRDCVTEIQTNNCFDQMQIGVNFN